MFENFISALVQDKLRDAISVLGAIESATKKRILVSWMPQGLRLDPCCVPSEDAPMTQNKVQTVEQNLALSRRVRSTRFKVGQMSRSVAPSLPSETFLGPSTTDDDEVSAHPTAALKAVGMRLSNPELIPTDQNHDSVYTMLLQLLALPLKTKEEVYQQSGDRMNAQRMRKKQHLLLDLSARRRYELRRFLDLEYWLRVVVQQEAVYLMQQQKIEKECGLGIEGEKADLRRKSIAKGLNWASKEYRLTRQSLHYFYCSTIDKPVTRAIRCLREDPKWHLSDFLRWDCADRGGCCSRACGCCERPRSTLNSLDLGHCTPACGCCAQYHGYRLKDFDTADTGRPRIDVMARRDDSFSGRMMDAHVWGLRSL
ncbi:hypothetical protein P170DRAFT_464272 [Aspergillus steynii IBT 23096]|uniref:Uncharacterized protein n=1 Tax=Aspergillus steynii IBT 23096 TaxID=1392250 RepID=A0A2I2GEN2_9EURO|nr:uncharacterized protein P170DRAFT_464272 [Aspergillus steynii IBT 23096]PLB51355.1 hypothetical protein P170DRAFT_464272 [Aspergillus steynii IBT 23096]